MSATPAASAEELVRRLLDAVSRNDEQAKAACVAEDLRWWVPDAGAARAGRPNPAEGRDVWLNLNARAASRYENWSWALRIVVVDEPYVAVMADVTATPHGRDAHVVRYGYFFRIEDGLIAECFELTDTAFLFERLGI